VEVKERRLSPWVKKPRRGALRRCPVAGAEAADEGGGEHEAAPALADEGGAGQGGRQRGEAEEDI
jgi:hypothetical protein